MSTHAIMIPLSAESQAVNQEPATPPVLRPRSDTILTTSSGSSSSSPYLQTPQTPSIMGVLHGNNGNGRGRAGSYGFDQYPKEMFEDTLPERLVEATSDERLGRVADPMSPELALGSPIQLPSHHTPSSHSGGSTADHGAPSNIGELTVLNGITSKPKSAARAKLERSKSSFKEAFRVKRPSSPDPGSSSSTSTHGDDGRRLRPRLRSLMSMSRSGSRSASNTSVASLSTSAVPMSAGIAAAASSTGLISEAPASGLRAQSAVQFRETSIPHLSADLEGPIIMHSPPRLKMKGRPTPTSTLSTESVWRHESRPAMISRSATAPLLVMNDTAKPPNDESLPPGHDLFDTMLPRELKIMIMKTLLNMSKDQDRERRWDGKIGARRELVKISRVSRSWQALCFDGQLWPILDLAPFASHFHPRTIGRIIDHSRSFITEMSLRGLDALRSRDLLSAITGPSEVRALRGRLPNLVSLDLRGCKNLDSDTILALIAAAPQLRIINLKGVQAVSSEVIRALARSSHHLETLDVSRCWDISLCDILVFIKMLTAAQAARIRGLRISGLKAYGTASADFLPLIMEKLVNLETLDLLGCTHIRDIDMVRACVALDNRQTPLTLRHLILSGCTSLSASIFGSMQGRFSALTRLELASLPDMFTENGEGEREFHKFLEGLPSLEKLDLEGTGTKGGVNDKMLEALIPARGETSRLIDLQIGSAKGVTPEGMIRFIRACPSLRNFEADNTSATNAVMREFHRRHRHQGSLSLIDCRGITPISYSHLAPTSRPRDGFPGYEAVPMAYEPTELEQKVVIKVFWSWRRVGVSRGWREALKDKEREHADNEGGESTAFANRTRGRAGKGKGWWKKDDPYDDRAGCVVQ